MNNNYNNEEDNKNNFDMEKRIINVEEKIKNQNRIDEDAIMKENELLFLMNLYNTALLPNINFGSFIVMQPEPEMKFLYNSGIAKIRDLRYYSDNFKLYNYSMFDKVSKQFYASLTQEELEMERDKLMELNEYFKLMWFYVEKKPEAFEEYFNILKNTPSSRELWTRILKNHTMETLINVNIRNYFNQTQKYINIFYNNIMKYFNLIEMRNEEGNGKYADTIFVFEYIPHEELEEVIEQTINKERLLTQQETRFKSPLKTNIEHWLKSLVEKKHFSEISFDTTTKEWVIPLSNLEESIIDWNKKVIERIYNSKEEIKEKSISYKSEDLPQIVKDFLMDLANSNNDTIIFEEIENKFYIQNDNIDEEDMNYNTLLITKINNKLETIQNKDLNEGIDNKKIPQTKQKKTIMKQ